MEDFKRIKLYAEEEFSASSAMKKSFMFRQKKFASFYI
jgi:hypothetical protein